ncbi:MAG: hypothetical protein JWP61_657 [Friedmanniella sp.]|nr:hypothetical protein [Friedmanniella sp.]
MSEFTSETSQAAQEEVQDVQTSPQKNEETLGASTPGDDALEKDPNDWVSGDDPITASQKSYLDTLAREAGEELSADMTKAEASQHIDRLKTQLDK